jgi:soluble lytic murein transglycosylase-like protein
MQSKIRYSPRAEKAQQTRAWPIVATLSFVVLFAVTAMAQDVIWQDAAPADIAWSSPAAQALPQPRPIFHLEQLVMAGTVAQTAPADVLSLPQKRPGNVVKVTTAAPVAMAEQPVVAAPSLSQAPVVKRQAYLLNSAFARRQPVAGATLAQDQADAYRAIFDAQNAGDFSKADALLSGLSDDRLMGYVLAERYLHPKYKASYAELSEWMQRYGDHPPAARIHALAKKKKKDSAVHLSAPRLMPGLPGLHDADVGQFPGPLRADAALRQDVARADEAKRLFFDGKTSAALGVAGPVAARSGGAVPLSAWIAGLAAWKQADYKNAARYFEMVANANRATPWMSSAGAYWAARSYLRARQPQRVSHWLNAAARHPRTFYGIIALKALGQEQDKFNWALPQSGDDHQRRLSAVPAGRRALALSAIGRADLAEAELEQIRPASGDYVLQEALLAVAVPTMPALSMRMGSLFRDKDGDMYDAALYPDAPWQPLRGFKVDRALVYAFIRQESKFQVRAENRSSGAKGIMQLMPATARHVAQSLEYTVDSKKLHDPVVNIDLGQHYIDELLNKSYVDQNLFKLAVAYNAGPAKLLRWQQSVSYEDDPLLFIESIPAAETRIFVERVLTNYWIYRLKYDQDTPSLDAVAGGEWPVYAAQDDGLRTRMALAY